MQVSSFALLAALLGSAAFPPQQSQPLASTPIDRNPTPLELALPSSIHWQDFDCDGRLDAYAVTRGGRNRLLRNAESGAFEDLTELVGLTGVDTARVVAWADADGDGWVDLACVSDGRLRLLRNVDGRTFAELDNAEFESAAAVQSLQWLDLDRDDLPELHVDAAGACALYRNLGRMRFERVELAAAGALGLDALPGPYGDIDDSLSPSSGASSGRASRALNSLGGFEDIDETELGAGPSNMATTCRRYVKDAITLNCIELSTVPTLGTIYPLGPEFNIDIGGNVGIGTTTPGDKLEIFGGGIKLGGSFGIAFHRASDGNLGLRVGTGAQGNTIRFYEAGNARSDILADSTGTHWDVLAGALDITQGGQVRHSFASATGKAALGLTEGVGIGDFANGNFFGIYKETQWSAAPGGFNVRVDAAAGQMEFGKPSANPSLYFSGDGNSANDVKLAVAVKNSANSNTITLRRDGRMYVAGNVGVGTTQPAAKLEVRDNDGGGGSGSAAVFAENTSTVGGVGAWAKSAGSDSTLVVDQAGTGPLIKGFTNGVERFNVNNSGRIVNTVDIAAAGTSGAALYTVNTATSGGIGIYAQATGTDATAVLVADGSGPLLKGIVAGAERFNVNNSGRIVNTVNIGSGGQAGASLFTTNTSTGNGVGIWTKTSGTDTTLVVDQVGTGPLIKGFMNGVERFNVNNSGRIVNTVNTAGGGQASASLFTTNTSTGNGVGIWAKTTGTDTTLVVDQVGTGPLIKGFIGGQEKFTVTSTGRVVTTALQITGGGDLVEGFDANADCEPGSVVVIDAEHPGRLKLSNSAYDGKVAGVVSGAGGVDHGIQMGQDGVLDGETLIAMTGRVWVHCSAENGAIEPGDRLTTASIAGHAMKATDSLRCDGAVIGKAMTELRESTGLVLVLVNLQ